MGWLKEQFQIQQFLRKQLVAAFGSTREGHCGLWLGSPFRTVIRDNREALGRVRFSRRS
jgi:hypothetical protein